MSDPSPNQSSESLQKQTFSLTGYSMWPLLQSGDEITTCLFTQAKTVKDCNLGEIALHYDGQIWVAHRVVQYSGRKVLKGDFSNCYHYNDSPLVWGIVTGRIRKQVYRQWGERSLLSRWIAEISPLTLSQKKWQRQLAKFFIFLLAGLSLKENGF